MASSEDDFQAQLAAETKAQSKTTKKAFGGRQPKVKKHFGREPLPAHLKKPAYVPTGKPRGRPANPDSEKKVYVPTGRPRGRPAGVAKTKAKKAGTPKKAAVKKTATSPATGRGRGRPKKEET